MMPFQQKKYSYKPVIDKEDEDKIYHLSKSEADPSRTGVMMDKLRRRKGQSLFYLTFLILVTYIVLSVILPGSSDWFMDDNEINSKETLPITETTGSANASNGPKAFPNISTSGGTSNLGTSSPSHIEFVEPSVEQEEKEDDSGEGTRTTSAPKNDTDKMACQLPKLDPFDQSIIHLVTESIHVDCSDKTPPIFGSTLNSTLVTLINPKDVLLDVESCCFETLTRGHNVSNPDNVYSFSDECAPVSLQKSSVTVIPTGLEFLVVSCAFYNRSKSSHKETNLTSPTPRSEPNTTSNETETYEKVIDMHLFVHEKPEVEKRIEKYYAELSNHNRNGAGSNKNYLLEKDKVNVVILGIDAVSRMNFIRTMPKSRDFLLNNLSAVEMKGFNKVGDNTYPNLIAALTSLNKSTFEATCQKDRFFDDCPFIWKKYAAEGYRTVYGEDSTWMGAFNYQKKGFRKPPTDYYLRPFGVAAEKLIGTYKISNARLCYDPRLSFEVLLDALRKFAFRMGHDKRYFQFTWATSLTHDKLNYGRLGDNHLLSTLKWFQDEGYLNNTVFILLSDHGIRWGKIHRHLQGQLEARLPFIYFVAPSWFQQKYKQAYANLRLNADRLTTNFDLHETLVDLLHLKQLQSPTIQTREQTLQFADKLGRLPRGISLFIPVPKSRTCEVAGIEEHYCTCHRLKQVNKTHPEVGQAANYIVHNINTMVSHYPQCGYLTLADIVVARVIDFGFNATKWKDGKGYEISLRTSPGDAVFEASVMQNQTGFWRVSGAISRTNLYGNQSHCVDEKELLLYCYCVDNFKL